MNPLSNSSNNTPRLATGIILSLFFAAITVTAPAYALETIVKTKTLQSGKYYTVKAITLSSGVELEQATINGPPKPPAGFEVQRQSVSLPTAETASASSSLTVPAYSWVFGCSAVSGAMIAGYYDRNGYPDIYTGPTDSGVMPLTNASWPTWSDGSSGYPSNPLVASKDGVDGRSGKGSIDDYWVQYDSTASDPYITGSWTQHTWGTAIGDYMKTSQSAYGNSDGSTKFYNYGDATQLTCSAMASGGYDDGTLGRKLFYEARGYTVTDCYNQKTDNVVTGGFSFSQFKSEIDAGHPVLLNLAGHSIVGVGYDESTSPATVYIHDTWDYSTHTMTWGGSYSGMELQSVSIVNLASPFSGSALLTVSKTGNGTVVSSPAGISCGGTCSYTFGTPQTIVLTATADSGSIFTGWSGGGCTGTGTCVVNLTGATAVAATFAVVTPVLSETFDATTKPASWTITDNAGTGAVWRFDNPGSRTNDTGGTGNAAIADSDYADTVNMDTELHTPTMNLSAYSTVLLKFKTDFYYNASEVADVDVSSNGAAGPWTNVWRKTGVDYIGSEQIDISSLAAGRSNVMVRFRYYNANYEWYWMVDDVEVVGFTLRTLTVNHAYTSAGIVNGGGSISGSGISCSSVNGGTKTGTCSASFSSGSTVTLAAAADANSTFSGWSGGSCTGIGECSFAINADTTVTGSFAGAYKAKISGGSGYDTLSVAYNNAGSGATILARELHNATSLVVEPFTENLTLTKAITLKGGYNAGFSSNAGLYSTLSGILTIGGTNGSLTVENLIIQ